MPSVHFRDTAALIRLQAVHQDPREVVQEIAARKFPGANHVVVYISPLTHKVKVAPLGADVSQGVEVSLHLSDESVE